ncbi:hypothetical protein PTSG_04385 [Salpingoeca rosetta]|uniref:Fibronectin type-III domain-containing protein n=1 Tax=Salpingoeca rosetta (strain ATCC 50818 / BSB-021) TaxID=946362 RepID=F2U8E2_SALR5|nr:uncharacterized protein PTSG_04385 [Salpingoeca rosetta]EGD72650.1 hypothetical protein PTSG_04385 [Salpingoeca rosetta]|eukprot:XP_004994473.1 hypothetical protein PTSG_04385 [Salpingoeca rosetta]
MFRVRLGGQHSHVAAQNKKHSGSQRGSHNADALSKVRENLPADDQPPLAPPAPRVEGVTKDTALLGWMPVRQNVSRLVIQALPLKKPTSKVAWKHFNLKKGVGHQVVISRDADKVNSGIVSGLQPGSYYVFRLIISNLRGATEGETSAPAQTSREVGKEHESHKSGTLFRHRRRRSTYSQPQDSVRKPSGVKHASILESHGSSSNNNDANTATAPTITPTATAATAAEGEFTQAYDNKRATTPTTLVDPGPAPAPPSSGSIADTTAHATATHASTTTPDSNGNASAEHIAQAAHGHDHNTDDGDDALVLEAPAARGDQHSSTTGSATATEGTGVGKAVPKSIAARLAVTAATVGSSGGGLDINKLESRLEQKEKQRKQATRLFKAEDKDTVGKSKIYQALNPQKLWFESRREREEKEEDAVRVDVRACAVGGVYADDDGRACVAAVSYARVYDDNGDVIAVDDDDDDDDDDEEEEDYDPDNLPDFGEYQKEMDEMRARRAAAQEARRKKMQEEWAAKKAAEAAALQREIDAIRQREAEITKKEEVTDDDVRVAQERVAEAAAFLSGFTFN